VLELVEKAKDGDLDAFGALVDRYKDMAYGASYAILGNFHDAQDVAQEAFVRAWQKLGDLQDHGGFPAWLYRIARNLSLDRVRRAREHTERIDDVADGLPDAASKGPGQRAQQHETQEAVLAAIRGLSEPNRLATTLFYIDGYSVDEVAGFLEVPAGTVKRRLHDSRAKLRERMVEMVEDTLKDNALPKDFSQKALEKIGDYTCLAMLGYGKMGSVYKCKHPVHKTEVAITIAAEGVNWGEGWRAEYDAFNQLNHPGLMKALSIGEHEGRPYIVMELLPGGSCWGWMDTDTPHPLWDVLQFMIRLADAVAYVHGAGRIVGGIGHQSIVVLPNDAPVLVSMGWVECTEQDDIADMGILMLELLLGRLVLDGMPREERRRAVPVPLPEDLRPPEERAPNHIMSVVEGCLQGEFSSADEALRALDTARFCELASLGSYGTQRLLRDIEAETTAAALVDAPEEITAHMFRNLGDEVRDWIRQEMKQRPASPNAAHAARCAIVATAQRLLEEKRIRFPAD